MRKTHPPAEWLAAEQRIMLELKNDPIPAVAKEDIRAACDAAFSYYVEKQSVWGKDFWKVTLSCASAEWAFLWMLSAFLLGGGVAFSLLAFDSGIHPIALMSALAPVPVTVFAIRELQYRDVNLVQLEKTCKYAPQKVYFARLWLGVLIHAVWTMAAGAAFCPHESIARLYICAFISLFLVGAVALLVMSLAESALPLLLLLAAWVLGAVFLLSAEEFIQMLASVRQWKLLVIMLISMGMFFIVTVKATAKRYA